MRDLEADLAAKSMRDLFELLAFHTLVWAIAILGGYLSALGLDAVGLSKGYWRFAPMPVTLIFAIILYASTDKATNEHPEARLRTFSQRYAFPIILLLGIGIGYQWHMRMPSTDPWRDEAIKQALRACSETPACIRNAESVTGSGTVLQYIKQP